MSIGNNVCLSRHSEPFKKGPFWHVVRLRRITGLSRYGQRHAAARADVDRIKPDLTFKAVVVRAAVDSIVASARRKRAVASKTVDPIV
jgi:hypothetical protein